MDKDMILQEKEAEVKCFKTLDNFSLIKKTFICHGSAFSSSMFNILGNILNC